MQTNSDMRKVLELVTRLQVGAQAVLRYSINPFVVGDNVAEHLARLARLLTYITPNLKAEFKGEVGLVEEVFTCLMVHDDEEVFAGFDIPTGIKNHDANDEAEIQQFTEAVSGLPVTVREFLISRFSSFRGKDSLAVKIAKVLDNIVGNQLVIEQGGLVNPDSARFCIEYVEKVKGASKTTDALVEAQIQQIIDWRNKAKALLEIDVTTHKLDKSKMYTPIDQW
jgi:5'-deoxynucleotidase YfbR-like HD superfamily hydrolase